MGGASPPPTRNSPDACDRTPPRAPGSQRARTVGSGRSERSRVSHRELELVLHRAEQLHRAEVMAMKWRQAARSQRRAVVDRRVTGVVLPSVTRVLAREARHEPI